MFTVWIIDGRLYQWDLGRQIKITGIDDLEVTEVEFACVKDTECLCVCPEAVDDGYIADIPNILLQRPENICVYVVTKDADCVVTRYKALLAVNPKQKPTDYVYTETEVFTVKSYVEQALLEAKESGLFDGPPGPKGDAGAIEFKIVNELPTKDISESTMYLVPLSQGSKNNEYAEYVYVEGHWEYIGSATVEVDLEDFVKKDDYATEDEGGVVKVSNLDYGLRINANGCLEIRPPSEWNIYNARQNAKMSPVTLATVDLIIKEVLKNPLVEWTDEEKAKALELLGGVNTSNVKVGEVANSIVKRGGSGTVSVATPLQDSHATPKKYVDDVFVAKESVSDIAKGNTIPLRDANGNIYVGTPTTGSMAANKNYVDDRVGSVESILTELHTYAQTKIGGEA